MPRRSLEDLLGTTDSDVAFVLADMLVLKEVASITSAGETSEKTKAIIDALFSSRTENRPQLILEVVTSERTPVRTRREILKRTKNELPEVFNQAVEEIFQQINREIPDPVSEDPDSYTAHNIASMLKDTAALTLVGNDEGLMERVIDAVKKSGASSELVKVLVASKNPDSRRVIFEGALLSDNNLMVIKAAQFAAERSRDELGLSTGEEYLLAKAINWVEQDPLDRRNVKIAEALRGAVTEPAIRALFELAKKDNGSALSALVEEFSEYDEDSYEAACSFNESKGRRAARYIPEGLYHMNSTHRSGMSLEQRREIMARVEGLGEFLISKKTRNDYYGVPQTWYTDKDSVILERACRRLGAEVLGQRDYGWGENYQKEAFDNTLKLLWKEGIRYEVGSDYYDYDTPAHAARAIKTLLKRSGRSYNNDTTRMLSEIETWWNSHDKYYQYGVRNKWGEDIPSKYSR